MQSVRRPWLIVLEAAATAAARPKRLGERWEALVWTNLTANSIDVDRARYRSDKPVASG